MTEVKIHSLIQASDNMSRQFLASKILYIKRKNTGTIVVAFFKKKTSSNCWVTVTVDSYQSAEKNLTKDPPGRRTYICSTKRTAGLKVT